MSLREANDAERRAAISRMVADRISDEMLTTPVGELKDWEAALLQAALAGPHGDEIMARIAALRIQENQP